MHITSRSDKASNTMASPCNEPKALSSHGETDEEVVCYATNPFFERSDVNAPSAHINNPLDEQQQLCFQQDGRELCDVHRRPWCCKAIVTMCLTTRRVRTYPLNCWPYVVGVVHRLRSYFSQGQSSMMALRASASVADVRLERNLRYEFAKLDAKGRYFPSILSGWGQIAAHTAGDRTNNLC